MVGLVAAWGLARRNTLSGSEPLSGVGSSDVRTLSDIGLQVLKGRRSTRDNLVHQVDEVIYKGE